MGINDCPIFIMSADKYSDIWPLFFDLFKMHWPEYKGIIFLQTENKTYKTDGLNILCTQLGKQKQFGKTFRKGIDKIESDHLLLITIDSIFMDKVSHSKLEEYYSFFIEYDLDSFCLIHQRYPHMVTTKNAQIFMVQPPAPHLMFSYQIAFWKKKILKEMALPHENPWTSEWYGTMRAEKMKIKLATISEKKFNPIQYHPAGCLHKGQWLPEAIDYLKSIDYKFDFEHRGLYKDPEQTLKHRFKVKWILVKDGIRGSYWDLYKRKPIQ